MKNTHVAVLIVLVLAAGALYFLKQSPEQAVLNDNQNEITENNNTPNEQTDNSAGIDLAGGIELTQLELKEFNVVGTNFAFEPSTIRVKKGDTVRITFTNNQGFHDFVIDEYGAATKQTNAPTTEVIEFVADKSGTFEYYCSVGSHKAMGMVGKLIVE